MFKRNKRQQSVDIQVQETWRVMANQLKRYQEGGQKCIGFTSHQKQQGKSYMIQSVATILARRGSKVLILDANVWSETLTDMYGKRLERGLLDLLAYMSESEGKGLSGAQLLEQYIYETKEANLYCLPKGGDEREFVYERIINEGYLKAILAELRGVFDYVLVEVPSFECLSYTQIMTTALDGCILMLKAGELLIPEATRVREQIESLGCEVLSCVLNEKEEIRYPKPQEEKVKQVQKVAKKKGKEVALRNNEGVMI